MNKEDVTRLAREVADKDKVDPVNSQGDMITLFPEELMRFIDVIQAGERTRLMQLFTDPENQPTQYGTVTLEYMEKEIAKEREARAKVCDEQAGSSSEGENEPYILRPLKLKEVK